MTFSVYLGPCPCPRITIPKYEQLILDLVRSSTTSSGSTLVEGNHIQFAYTCSQFDSPQIRSKKIMILTSKLVTISYNIKYIIPVVFKQTQLSKHNTEGQRSNNRLTSE